MSPLAETFSQFYRQYGHSLKRDGVEMAEARKELARLEMRDDLNTIRHSALLLGIGILAIVAGLPLLAILLAARLHHLFPGLPINAWQAIVAVVFLSVGSFLAWQSWRKIRRDLRLFEASRAELSEDLLWLKEMLALSPTRNTNE